MTTVGTLVPSTSIVNKGVDGRSIFNAWEAYDTDVKPNTQAYASKTTVLIFLGGYNTFGTGTGADAWYGTSTTQGALQFLSRAKAQGCYTVVIGAPPCTTNPTSTLWDNNRLQFNSLAQAAASAGVIDFYHDFGSWYDPSTMTIGDGVHPNSTAEARLGTELVSDMKAHFGWP
jgi:hypothetical protein